MPRLTYAEAAPGGVLSASRAPSVNDARYADYIAFADARTGLYAVPDGVGGKRKVTAAEFWATPANASFDSSLYGVQDIVLSARTAVSAAVTAVLNSTEATLVCEFYGRSTTERLIQPSGSNDLFLLAGTGANAQMVASSTALTCGRRRGNWQARSRAVVAWSAAGRTISMNGGAAAEDAIQPGNRNGVNFIAGRYAFIGVIAGRKSAAWIKGNSFPEPAAVIHGDSLAQGDTNNTGFWSAALTALLPGSPPMENMGIGGETGAQIETRFLSEAVELNTKRIVWGGHNGYNADDWKARVANMIANTNGGLANFALLPTFPSFADGAGTLASKADLHAWFKATYGPHYLGQVLDQIVALGAPGQPYADAASYAKGVPPVGLRYDNLHLSKACTEGIVAPMIRAAYPQLGWRV